MAQGSLPAGSPFFAPLWGASPRNGLLVHHKVRGVLHRTSLQAGVQRKAFQQGVEPQHVRAHIPASPRVYRLYDIKQVN